MSQHEWEAWDREIREQRMLWVKRVAQAVTAFCVALTAAVLAPRVVGLLGLDERESGQPRPSVALQMERAVPRGASARAPDPGGQVRTVRRMVRNYVGVIEHRSSGFTRFDDPGDPYRKTYASVNFLPGGRLFDPARPFRRRWTRVADSDYTVAVPRRWRHLFEERIELESGYWYHRYRLWVEGYTPPGVYAVPRDRITKYDRFDCFFSGWDSVRRAHRWGCRDRAIEIYRYDWVTMEVRDGEPETGGAQDGRGQEEGTPARGVEPSA